MLGARLERAGFFKKVSGKRVVLPGCRTVNDSGSARNPKKTDKIRKRRPSTESPAGKTFRMSVRPQRVLTSGRQWTGSFPVHPFPALYWGKTFSCLREPDKPHEDWKRGRIRKDDMTAFRKRGLKLPSAFILRGLKVPETLAPEECYGQDPPPDCKPAFPRQSLPFHKPHRAPPESRPPSGHPAHGE